MSGRLKGIFKIWAKFVLYNSLCWAAVSVSFLLANSFHRSMDEKSAQQMFIFFSFSQASAPTVTCPRVSPLHKGSLVSFLGESLKGPGSKASDYSMQPGPNFCYSSLVLRVCPHEFLSVSDHSSWVNMTKSLVKWLAQNKGCYRYHHHHHHHHQYHHHQWGALSGLLVAS